MTADPVPLYWRLRVLMAEREIDSTRELRRRLAATGYEISEAQLGRVRKRLPRLLDTTLLAALCDVLGVDPGDLLIRKGKPAIEPKGRSASEPEERSRRATTSAQDDSSVAPPPRLEEMSFPSSGPDLGPLRRPKM